MKCKQYLVRNYIKFQHSDNDMILEKSLKSKLNLVWIYQLMKRMLRCIFWTEKSGIYI